MNNSNEIKNFFSTYNSICLLLFKDKIEIVAPPPSEKALIVYQEAMDLMDEGQFSCCCKKIF